jgi:hypothetical protein
MGPLLCDDSTRTRRNLTELSPEGESQSVSQKPEGTQEAAPEAGWKAKARTRFDRKITQELKRLFSSPLQGWL